MFEKYFQLKANKTDFHTEVVAGITTFLTMAYILAVNPIILGKTGMDSHAVFTATALSAIIATLVMALYAKLPFALASGMGLNAFFAYTVVLGMGYDWEFALTAVFTEGIIFIVMSFFNIRELIIDAIPLTLKNSISVGIGLFIAFIGLHSAGIIVQNPATLVGLGTMNNPIVWVSLLGLLISGVLLVLRVKGALLIGIFASTIIGIPLGITHLPVSSVVQLPPSIAPIFFKFRWSQMFSLNFVVIMFTFLFVDIFDTVGTLIGVATKANMLDDNGRLHNVGKALMADAIGTVVGAVFGTSTVTTYVESAAGVSEGGRTGLTSLVTASLFIVALFLAPLFLMVPAAATAPALILVGLFMMSTIINIPFDDYTESLPAFLSIIIMPLTYSIADGIAFGMVSYVLLKVLSGKYKEINWMMYILTAVFVLKYAF